MPVDNNGNYSLPSGTLVNTGDTIQVSQHNPAMTDIANALSGSLNRDGFGGMRAALKMGANKITGCAPGTDPTDAATVSQLTSSTFPVGCVMDFAGSSAPNGWLICGGQSLNRTTYAALFAVIGTTYGSADGSSFNLPDLRGRVTAGRDFSVSGSNASRLTSATMTPDGATLAATGGAQTQTLTEAQMPAHTHTGSTSEAGTHSHSYFSSGNTLVSEGGTIPAGPTADTTDAAGAHTHTMSLNNTGGGQAHPNVQPTMIMTKIIKV